MCARVSAVTSCSSHTRKTHSHLIDQAPHPNRMSRLGWGAWSCPDTHERAVRVHRSRRGGWGLCRPILSAHCGARTHALGGRCRLVMCPTSVDLVHCVDGPGRPTSAVRHHGVADAGVRGSAVSDRAVRLSPRAPDVRVRVPQGGVRGAWYVRERRGCRCRLTKRCT